MLQLQAPYPGKPGQASRDWAPTVMTTGLSTVTVEYRFKISYDCVERESQPLGRTIFGGELEQTLM